jgi:hypothetical protein
MVKFKFWKKEAKPISDTSNSDTSEEKEKEYNPPKMNASGTDKLYEEVAIKPIRLDEA